VSEPTFAGRLAELVKLHAAIPDPQFGDATLDEARLTLEAEFFRSAHALVPDIEKRLNIAQQVATALASEEFSILEKIVEKLQEQVTQLAGQLNGIRGGRLHG
jgi:hypothetical protein